MIKKLKKLAVSRRTIAVLLAFVSMVTVGIVSLTSNTRAAPLGYPVIFNHPYSAPSPIPSVFGPDKVAWSHYEDHPGHDTAYNVARSRAYTGDTSPNHVHLGSSSLVFMGYDKAANLDYVFAENYSQFSSVSFALRPMGTDAGMDAEMAVDSSFHALGQSGFLFNGRISGGLYTGYMIVLEARDCDDPADGRCADLRLYYVLNADMNDVESFADMSRRMLISTYAVDIRPNDPWPVYVRVESDPLTHQFQVFIDGELRTRSLAPLSTYSGFGFFTSYIEHDCSELTVVAYANLHIEVPFITPPPTVTATVRFLDFSNNNAPLADDQTITGVVGQSYYITPPDFPGYYLIEANQKQLNPISYFARNEYNITTLYYMKEGGCFKSASYLGVPGNGTASNPVQVTVGNQIDYKINVAGDGTRYEGAWRPGTARMNLISMSRFAGYNATSNPMPVIKTPGPTSFFSVTSNGSGTTNGEMTLESNYPMEINAVQSNASGFSANDGVVVGFTPLDRQPGVASTLYVTGNPGLPQLTYGSGALPTFPFVAAPVCNQHSATNLTNNAPLIRSDERYIKVIYNRLRNDSSFQLEFLMGCWSQAQPGDYIIDIHCRNSLGAEVHILINRSTLFSPNNGWAAGVVPVNLLPAAGDYTSAQLPDGRIYPIDGKIDVTFTRLHNARHDYNILVGAGQLDQRSREIIVTVTDVLPLGLSYVPDSSGPYEGHLTITTLPTGQQELKWEFGVLPPDGYEIPFKVKVDQGGLFVNEAYVQYVPNALMSTWTNRTYHVTDLGTVTEHFLDFAAPHATLRPDRVITLPKEEHYITSVVSMSEILYNGNTYHIAGYRRVGIDPAGVIQPGEPPLTPYTIAGSSSASQREIYLYFAKNPTVTVEFKEIGTGATLKPSMNFPVTYGDPFFLPDSAREPIWQSGDDYYNYTAYNNNIGSGIVHGLPDKPVYNEVKQDRTLTVYFELKEAVTIHYVEYQNRANVLRNDDYYLVDKNSNFSVVDAMDTNSTWELTVLGKRYIYEGYSLPGGMVIPAPPPDFLNIQGNKEITLYYSTYYVITVKWHEDLPYGESVVYADLLPPTTFTVKAGNSFSITPQGTITYNGADYTYKNAHKWSNDAQPVNPGNPVIPMVYGDYTIILLYEKGQTNNQRSVLVMFREYSNTSNKLTEDRFYTVADGSNFSLGTLPEFDLWEYHSYQVDGFAYPEGVEPPDPFFTNINANHVVLLLYTRRTQGERQWSIDSRVNELGKFDLKLCRIKVEHRLGHPSNPGPMIDEIIDVTDAVEIFFVPRGGDITLESHPYKAPQGWTYVVYPDYNTVLPPGTTIVPHIVSQYEKSATLLSVQEDITFIFYYGSPES